MRSQSVSFTCSASRCGLVALVLCMLAPTGREVRAQVTRDTTSAPECDGSPTSTCTPRVMSLVQLLASPERFDGKRVRVIGFVHLEFEGDAVYLHREDFERGLNPNGLSVGFRPDLYRRGATFNDRYVLLEGTFRARGGWLSDGAITDISSADVWPSHATIEQRMRGFQVLTGKPKVPTKPRP
jgi:hypothetical protein